VAEAATAAPEPPQVPAAQVPAGAGGADRSRSITAVDVEAIRRMWPDVLTRVYQQRRTTWTFVSEHAQVLDYDGKRLRLAISTDGLLATFRRGPHAELIRQALIDVFGVDAQVEGIKLDSPSDSAAATASATSASSGQAASPAPAGPGDRRAEVSPGARAAAAARSWDEPAPPEPDREEPPPPEMEPAPVSQSARAAEAGRATQAARKAQAVSDERSAADGSAGPDVDLTPFDAPHRDDADLHDSGLVGQSVVEQLLGGRVIDDAP
jgi:DNA polymerase-3 subunit gamma/tau